MKDKSKLALCGIAKDESPYILEWIDYHFNLGFDSIFLYDNNSSDDTVKLAKSRQNVYLTKWSPPIETSPQVAAYRHFLENKGDEFEWVIFLDLDEFLNIKIENRVQEFLRRFEGADGIAINWRMFGSSGLANYSPEPVLTRFRMASPEQFPANVHVKTLFKPSKILDVGVHSPVFTEDANFIDASGNKLRGDVVNVFAPEIRLDYAQINHYFVKSREEFTAKRRRGRADMAADDNARFRSAEEFDVYDRNDELDETILRPRQ